MQPLFYGTVAPLLIYFTVKKLILDPLEARKKKADKAKKYESVRARVAEARKEAMASIDLMKERFNRIRQDEMTKGGLVVVAAIYGKLINGIVTLT
jgi:DnaJ family protein C protein 11